MDNSLDELDFQTVSKVWSLSLFVLLTGGSSGYSPLIVSVYV